MRGHFQVRALMLNQYFFLSGLSISNFFLKSDEGCGFYFYFFLMHLHTSTCLTIQGPQDTNKNVKMMIYSWCGRMFPNWSLAAGSWFLAHTRVVRSYCLQQHFKYRYWLLLQVRPNENTLPVSRDQRPVAMAKYRASRYEQPVSNFDVKCS